MPNSPAARVQACCCDGTSICRPRGRCRSRSVTPTEAAPTACCNSRSTAQTPPCSPSRRRTIGRLTTPCSAPSSVFRPARTLLNSSPPPARPGLTLIRCNIPEKFPPSARSISSGTTNPPTTNTTAAWSPSSVMCSAQSTGGTTAASLPGNGTGSFRSSAAAARSARSVTFDLNLATTPGTTEYNYLIKDMDIAATNLDSTPQRRRARALAALSRGVGPVVLVGQGRPGQLTRNFGR